MFQAVSTQTLESYELQVDSRTAVTVMTVAGGYPETYDKGFEISGIDTITEAIAFHAGTTLQDKKVLTNGGRVMAVTALAHDLPSAIKKSYQNVEKLHFDKMYYRTDIGKDLL
jgi:phosphoribosylamine--glycine ligase